MYKPGDRVVIRKNLVVGEQYGFCTYLPDMEKDFNKDYVTIKAVLGKEPTLGYELDCDWLIPIDFVERRYGEFECRIVDLTRKEIIELYRSKLLEVPNPTLEDALTILDEVERRYG